jgi:hypothetical protein
MKESTWTLIEERFARRPQTKATAVDPAEFDAAIRAFCAGVDDDYRQFVLRYGGGFVGAEPIYGLRKAEFMGTVGGVSTAPELTRLFRSKRWPGVDNWFIFSIDQGGNPIGFAGDGTVWLSDQLDFRQIVQLATDFEDYLLKWCLQTRKVG